MKKLLVISLLFFAVKSKAHPPQLQTAEWDDPTVAIQWGEMTLKVFDRLPQNSPTYCSRALGYIGLTMYESVVAGSAGSRSMVGQLTGLENLPKANPALRYNWHLVLSAGQAFILKKIIDNKHRERIFSIDSLDYDIQQIALKKESAAVFERSINLGQAIAQAIFDWSKTDGGHEAYLRNFDPKHPVPQGESYWIPPTKAQVVSPYPLHPHWGTNRRFVPANQQTYIPPIEAYSKDPKSAYYALFNDVYQKNKILTTEEKEIAAWWADDPTEVFSPPGHSYSLANIAVRTARPNLFKAAETYARVGIAVADAFMRCWQVKYVYHSERPSTYVRAVIDPTWEPFWPEPPFPAFISGHATQGAAAAIVLTDLYGGDFAFLDITHQNRPRDPRGADFKARHYASFWASAEESAYSRFLGGIHTRQDNEIGLTEGRKIGENINALRWKTK